MKKIINELVRSFVAFVMFVAFFHWITIISDGIQETLATIYLASIITFVYFVVQIENATDFSKTVETSEDENFLPSFILIFVVVININIIFWYRDWLTLSGLLALMIYIRFTKSIKVYDMEVVYRQISYMLAYTAASYTMLPPLYGHTVSVISLVLVIITILAVCYLKFES